MKSIHTRLTSLIWKLRNWKSVEIIFSSLNVYYGAHWKYTHEIYMHCASRTITILSVSVIFFTSCCLVSVGVGSDTCNISCNIQSICTNAAFIDKFNFRMYDRTIPFQCPLNSGFLQIEIDVRTHRRSMIWLLGFSVFPFFFRFRFDSFQFIVKSN